jgi:hypothetical protein
MGNVAGNTLHGVSGSLGNHPSRSTQGELHGSLPKLQRDANLRIYARQSTIIGKKACVGK